MKISIEKDGLTYDIKPYFNMAFLFAPITLFLMNMFYCGFIYIVIIALLQYFNILYIALIINIILFLFGGHMRILYLYSKGYRIIKNSTSNEKNVYEKIIKR